jgi:hypothetical protein
LIFPWSQRCGHGRAVAVEAPFEVENFHVACA